LSLTAPLENVRFSQPSPGRLLIQIRLLVHGEPSGASPVAACGEATKPGLAPNGSQDQQPSKDHRSQRKGDFLLKIHAKLEERTARRSVPLLCLLPTYFSAKFFA